MRTRPLVMWAWTGADEDVQHGYWMLPMLSPYTVHPTQLCDVNVMVAYPEHWRATRGQPKEKCKECLAVLVELLTRALLEKRLARALHNAHVCVTHDTQRTTQRATRAERRRGGRRVPRDA